MQIIENLSIRKEWDEKSQKWYFSVVDSVGIMNKSSDPRNYWKVLKSRLKNSQNQLVTRCNQLKMRSGDGKFYLTDVGDQETILEIVKLVSPGHLPSFMVWFEKIGEQKEQNSPSLKIDEILENDSYPQPFDENEEYELLVDAYQTNDSVIIKTFIAGASEEDISISLSEQTLTIQGHRSKPQTSPLGHPMSKWSIVQEELCWGKFSRSINIPVEVKNADDVETTLSSGVLTIKLEKIKKAVTKKVIIKSI